MNEARTTYHPKFSSLCAAKAIQRHLLAGLPDSGKLNLATGDLNTDMGSAHVRGNHDTAPYNRTRMADISKEPGTTINKIAEITIYFWVLKILTTTLGETAGDYLSMTLNLGYLQSLGITGVALIILITLQVRFNRYLPLAFWAAIVATTTAGYDSAHGLFPDPFGPR